MIAEKKPDTILLLSARPIGPLDPFTAPLSNPGSFNVSGLDRIQAGLPQLDPKREPLVFIGDVDLTRALLQKAKEQGFAVEKTPHTKLEEPSSLALYALNLVPDHAVTLLFLGLPYQSPEKLHVFGKVLGEILQGYPKKVAVIAAADLSARLSTET